MANPYVGIVLRHDAVEVVQLARGLGGMRVVRSARVGLERRPESGAVVGSDPQTRARDNADKNISRELFPKLIEMKKIVLLSVLIISLGLFFWNGVKAGTTENVSGWAWAEPNPDTSIDIGWISFNSLNCDSDSNGFVDVACGGDNATVPISNYGVNVDLGTGIFSGYAWSENIGWITFNSAELVGCPTVPCEARLDTGTNQVSGWARACAGAANADCTGGAAAGAGGWDGWIQLRDTSPISYGVSADPPGASPREFREWAWGGGGTDVNNAVVGWISFNRVNCDTDRDGFSNGGPGCPAAGTIIANYKVYFLNRTPSATSPNDIQGNYCTTTCQNYPYITLGWTYSDPDGDLQNGYRVQVDNDGDFTAGIIYDSCPAGSGCSGGISPTHAPPASSGITFNSSYWWRVMVWDSNGAESAWSATDTFTTGSRPPCVDFEWQPPSPSKDEIIQFCSRAETGVCPTDKTSFYGAGPTWAWDFDNNGVNEVGPGSTFDEQNPTYSYSVAGPYTAKLTVADSNGSCFKRKPLTVISLPKWKEIAPTSFFEKFFITLLRIFFV